LENKKALVLETHLMRIALCTTTIHVPHALKLMRKCSGDVKFFVAIDEKTPREIFDLKVENTSIVHTGNLGNWKCSEAIGHNTLARRNIAFLEAVAWGADAIYSHDDDNLPVDCYHFDLFDLPARRFNGIKVSGLNGWFDPGTLLVPSTRHRGFPYDMPHRSKAEPVTDARIGIAAGLVIGDPDVDAVTRMEHCPDIGAVHLLGQTGVVVDPHTWTVFNSQNTVVIRELIPAWFMMPGVGRHDDIYASLIVQRVARERDLHVHFGPPFTYQQRNEHNPITDLRAEIDGMERVQQIADALDRFRLKQGASVVEHTRAIYIYLASERLIPDNAFTAAFAYLDDCEGLGL
jgi:hypothetical protein